MIKLFNNIRKKLVSENNSIIRNTNYFKYALGEIVLVVVGILIALQVNNWNENRKQEATFKITLEQIYNTLKLDSEFYNSQIKILDDKIKSADRLLTKPDSIPLYFLPYALNDLLGYGDAYKSGTEYHAKNLTYNPNNKVQNEISKQITNYVNNLTKIDIKFDSDLTIALKNIDLAYPKFDPGNPMNGWITNDSTYYSKNDLENASKLIHSNKFKTILKNYSTNILFKKNTTISQYIDGVSIIKLIKDYYPKVKLIYMDVGVKGTAIDGFDNVNGKSTPMEQTDIENDVWQVDIYLQKGRIKFRCHDSWAINWGADTFPKGVGFQEGPDILVSEAGNYHIVFKPVTGEYEFIKKEE